MNRGTDNRESNEDMLQKMLWEMSPDLLLVYSDEEVVFCNDAGCHMLEAENNEDILHKKFIRLVDSDFRNHYEKENCVYGSFAEEIFVTLRFRKIWVEVRKSEIRFNNSDAVLVYARNINRVKEAEHAYIVKNDQVNRMILSQLTRREKTILDLYGEGKNRVAISRELDIEEGTVDRHTTNIKKKLNKKSMKELLNFAMDIKSEEKPEDFLS